MQRICLSLPKPKRVTATTLMQSFCEAAIIPGGLTRFIQYIDMLLAHCFRDEYFETRYKPWFEALPVGSKP